jgi:hypothetical protein
LNNGAGKGRTPDKDIFHTETWEKWVHKEDMLALMQIHGPNALAEFVAHDQASNPDGLFICWYVKWAQGAGRKGENKRGTRLVFRRGGFHIRPISEQDRCCGSTPQNTNLKSGWFFRMANHSAGRVTIRLYMSVCAYG